MNCYAFRFADHDLTLLPSGALWWPDQDLLCVSDLHLGKSERQARRGGHLLPPYDTRDTLMRLEADIARTKARSVLCLGDSFDDLTAANQLDGEMRQWLSRLMAGRRWIWIEGNHDPGPVEFGGTHLADCLIDTIQFRHIADPQSSFEVSGHYHPKTRLSVKGRGFSRPCMLVDRHRIILPAYGTYTGGLRSDDPVLSDLMQPNALAVLLGVPPHPVPMQRGAIGE
ncbi:ligase-associated DNA damage response endonuclease PdeM [Aliiroseovarius salicola]|uniref:ligase-associated DNA damage response endonuclease PdeM n=1 Tax=Aliiroseovarius salicola TaxID=3009082 RepID=UPI0038CC1263